ncbi:hypothetical protein [Flavihumibacter solisilvae]|uniref:Uncharacterized protein n=1 Tax=Flavihumibacter solisilvae TaxID=1349421 RepID=A0A0C1L392_9BACT|nr:hypothetical protein [Flavihumibacter solisilvae]KIC94442.1 hypothetical protein OI18_12625 [Flavihumibacter solisilvae]
MNDLLKKAIGVQGGMDTWKKYNNVFAHLSVGGILWGMKGHPDSINNVDVVVDLHEQKASHIPNAEWYTAYTPGKVQIKSGKSDILEETDNPRDSFKGHMLETQWSNLQLAYFAGYAMWNYLNTPFLFARLGFDVIEIESWTEGSENWRRLNVKWPKDIHTHSTEQILYIDDEGFIRRLDYQVEIAGNTPAAHYLYDYKEVDGIKMATRRIVYPIGENNMAIKDGLVIVSIDLSEIKLS